MRVGGLVAALIFIVLGSYGLQDCAAHETLRCDRANAPRCTRVAGTFTSATTVFEGDALAWMRSIRHQGKGRPTYTIVIVDRAGTPHEVVHRVDEAVGTRAASWLSGTDPTLLIEQPRTPIGLVLAGGMIALGLFFAGAALFGGRKRRAAAPS